MKKQGATTLVTPVTATKCWDYIYLVKTKPGPIKRFWIIKITEGMV